VAEITSAMIKELRSRTQVGMLDCKKALKECDGDIEKSIDFLRKKGLASASKKVGKDTLEGIITSYIHTNLKLGVLLKLNCETDFVAKNEDFQNLGKEICMQIAATNPRFVSIEDVPEDVLDREKDIYRDQLKDSNKPPEIIEKIVTGKLKKFYTECCLLEQEYIRESKITISELIKNKISTYGENISIGRFIRYQIGS